VSAARSRGDAARLRAAALGLGLAMLAGCAQHGGATAWAAAPYAGRQQQEISSLSPQQIGDLRAGRGMGLALPAELNGYPGPLHVLELAAALELSAEQRARTEALHARMQAAAREAGARWIEAERELDALFRSRQATPQSLRAALDRVGALQARVRDVHLQAHLEQTALLTPAQIDRYVQLRGYGGGHGGHHKHQ
jgi:hypothetical protein